VTATLEIQALAEEWAEDREAMADERREALLDWVRGESDRWRQDLGLSAMPGHVAYALDIRWGEAARLCEEAGCQ